MEYETINNYNEQIYVELCGGLGNQLFQYATARTIADRLCVELVCVTKWFGSKGNVTNPISPQRAFGLKHFKHARYSVMENVPRHVLNPFSKSNNYVLYKIRKILVSKYTHSEIKCSSYDDSVHRIPSGVMLKGYYQNFRYFQHNQKRIKDDLVFTTPLTSANAELSDKIQQDSNSISLHFRRMDYLNPVIQHRMATCSMEYYRRALSYIFDKTGGGCKLYLFSDDIEWVKHNVDFDFRMEFVDINDNKNGHFDLHLQSLCSHNIIANSTMSLWAAWLNANPNKIVCAPKKWYVGGGYNPATDLWTLIEN